MFNALLHKLIHQKQGKWSSLLANVALFVACILILAAVQIQANYSYLLTSSNNQDSLTQYIVINKALTNNTIGKTSISKDEIEALKTEKLIEEVGVVIPSHFKATIESKSAQLPFRTDISFEALPDNFLQLKSNEWHWDQGDKFVPLLAPTMFLDIYNFQFALGQGLPQLTQDIVKMIVFNVNVATPIGTKQFDGRIIGFSQSLSSLVVPQTFMNWANGINEESPKPNRLLIKTKDPTNSKLISFLDVNGFTTQSENIRFSKYRKIINIVAATSSATGMAMLAFAALIFSLFIKITIATCKGEIELLLTLGTAPKKLVRFLIGQFLLPNIVTIVSAFICVFLMQFYLYKYLVTLNIFVSTIPSWHTIVAAVLLFLFFAYSNWATLRKMIYT
jgi:hypothetical protein